MSFDFKRALQTSGIGDLCTFCGESRTAPHCFNYNNVCRICGSGKGMVEHLGLRCKLTPTEQIISSLKSTALSPFIAPNRHRRDFALQVKPQCSPPTDRPGR